MPTTCSGCGNEYTRVAQHWQLSSCEPAELSDDQLEILTGLLMGDGTIGSGSSESIRIEANMTNEQYLEYLDRQFPLYGNGVMLKNTSEENVQRDRESGFNESADPSNYSDTYTWRTMVCPVFDRFQSWYGSKGKQWPDDLELTPIVLKHWYCCDGYRHDSESHDNITISMNNERRRRDSIEKLFENANLPVPTWQINDRGDFVDCVARFTKPQSIELWKYMGEPLPGFEYKWSTSDRS